VLGVRKLSFIPSHFTKLSLNTYVDTKKLETWIEYNLNSRYAIVNTTVVDNENKITDIIEIGLEDPKEVILLSMGCPFIHIK
jgi:hypothetical protein